MKDDRIYLRHIQECIEAIQDYNTQGRDTFLTDRKTCKATLRELQEFDKCHLAPLLALRASRKDKRINRSMGQWVKAGGADHAHSK